MKKQTRKVKMPQNFGQLTADELELYHDMQKAGDFADEKVEEARKAHYEFESKKALFWGTVEGRLKIYDKNFKIALKDFIVENEESDEENYDEDDLPFIFKN